MVGLGPLPGFENGAAYAVSADGSVIVGESGSKAFRWTADSGMSAFETLSDVTARYHATAVSADGRFATGIVHSRPNIPGYEAVAWLPDLTLLGDLPSGEFYSEGRGISADGSVIVGIGHGSGSFEAFRTENGEMIGMGYLSGAVGNSAATAVTPDGNVIVGYSSSPGQRLQAFRWTADEGMISLGALGDPSVVRSEATAVSADGSRIVGHSGWDGSTQDAFIWDSTNGMRGIRDILTGAGIDLTGWGALHACGISGDGETIVGIGHRIGSQHYPREAWMATIRQPAPIPEPTSLAIWSAIALGGLGLAYRRQKRAA